MIKIQSVERIEFSGIIVRRCQPVGNKTLRCLRSSCKTYSCRADACERALYLHIRSRQTVIAFINTRLVNAPKTHCLRGGLSFDPRRGSRRRHWSLNLWTLRSVSHAMVCSWYVTFARRRMFPVVKVVARGLEPAAMYTLLLEFVQIDPHR